MTKTLLFCYDYVGPNCAGRRAKIVSRVLGPLQLVSKCRQPWPAACTSAAHKPGVADLNAGMTGCFHSRAFPFQAGVSLSVPDRKAHASSGCNSPRFHPQDFSLDYKLGSGLREVNMGGLSPGPQGPAEPMPRFSSFLRRLWGIIVIQALSILISDWPKLLNRMTGSADVRFSKRL